ADADERWRAANAPLVEAALLDGTVDDGVDPDAVLFLVRVLRLGLLLHRGSGLAGPDPDGWADLMARVIASFGRSDLEHRHDQPPIDLSNPPPATSTTTTAATSTAATSTATSSKGTTR
ncbi:MAG: hypothetical protein JJE52_14120, partial [Acidimicrobiia bacterium]|nr:hypothetical protein [Acidimicrobiia bacterium]